MSSGTDWSGTSSGRTTRTEGAPVLRAPRPPAARPVNANIGPQSEKWLDRIGLPYRDICFLGAKPEVEQINVSVFGFSRGAAEARRSRPA